VSFFEQVLGIWREDSILRRVVKNSGHLLSGNAVSAGLGFLQGILVLRLIGVTQLGLVVIVTTFATNINRLLSFRMNEVVVQRLGAALPRLGPGSGEQPGQRTAAAASVKAAMLTEALTSVLAFLILVALIPWAIDHFRQDIQTAPLFLLYGLILLSNIIAESSTGVLQAVRRFAWIARLTMLQSVLTAGIVLFAFLSHGNVFEIILAYTIGKTINGLGLAILALRELRATLGEDWWKTPLSRLPDPRAMFSFMVNTNLNSTVSLFTRDNMPLYLAYLLSATEVGYFSLALTLVNFIMLPLDPLIGPTYAELTRTVALKDWDATRRLLRRVSMMTAAVVLSVSALLALFGRFLLSFLYRPETLPAYPALLILLVGYGFASVFQWNRPLLLALGRPGFPVLVAFLVGLAELALIYWLVPLFGYLALAAILSAYFVVSVGIIVRRGLLEISRLSNLKSPI
jgi:O-antigen/teichoic acid export membrane protein